MVSSLSTFIAELRRRRVFRVAAVYGGVAFVLTEIVSNVFPALHIPDWAESMVVVLIILGFPIAIGLAWAFDITPEGIVRTEGRSTGKPGTGNRTLIAVTILAVAFGMWGWMRDGVGTVGTIRSIAVLPLANLMNDPEQDYFVDGMHEALTAELSKISALRVIGRTSTMSYKANPKPIPEIAAELNVDAVIEGSVLRDGDIVRITVQLVATNPERHLWSNSYDRGLRDILNLHSDVARAIAEQIKATLTPDEIGRLTTTRQVNPEAYDLYLRGWHFRTKESVDTAEKAMGYLERAIAIDPDFARAYALMSHQYFMHDWLGLVSGLEARTKAKNAIEKALELDDNLPETQLYLGLYLYSYEWDWAGAERAFKRAIELGPNHVHAHFEYSLFLSRMGRLEEALMEAQRAKNLDPLSLQADYGLGLVYLYSRQYDKSIKQFKRIVELDPAYYSARWTLAQAYTRNAMVAEALKEYQTLEFRPGIMAAHYAMGRKTEALAYFDSMKVVWEKDGAWLMHSGSYFSILSLNDDKEEALKWLEKAYHERQVDLRVILTDPTFDFLRAAPRFKTILANMGL